MDDARRNGEPAAAPRCLKIGLVGAGIQRSRTPRMHEREARAHGIDCRAVLFDTADGGGEAARGEPLGAILARAEAQGFTGLNVTYPYKQEVIAHLHDLCDAAREVGAVNTVLFRDGRRIGDNTDLWGFAESLRLGLADGRRETVLLIGAGGAGAAVGHALLAWGARTILVADVREGAARALAASLNAAAASTLAFVAPDLAQAARAADGIVNATPVGMAATPGTPLDTALLERRHFVADVIYVPLETPLLAAARAAGCVTLGGEGMALFQAVRAFELFTGIAPDAERMRRAFWDEPAR